MSSLDFTGLADLAKRDPAKVAQPWEPPSLDDFGYGRVLAFDQSLTATGWIELVHPPGRGMQVVDVGSIKVPEAVKGVETDLRRGVIVYREARHLICYARIRGCCFVHESPPNMAALKGKGSPVSSLMAAQAVRCAAEEENVEIEMLGAQPAKKLVSNQSKEKTIAHDMLKQHYLPHIEGGEKVTNEGQRDALLLALLKLHRSPR